MRPAYQQRVLEECEELRGRMDRLEAFILSAAFEKVEAAEQDRMRRQFAAMATYLGVLTERINAFPPPAEEPASPADSGANL